jgi:hypothetical protein
MPARDEPAPALPQPMRLRHQAERAAHAWSQRWFVGPTQARVLGPYATRADARAAQRSAQY